MKEFGRIWDFLGGSGKPHIARQYGDKQLKGLSLGGMGVYGLGEGDGVGVDEDLAVAVEGADGSFEVLF